MELRVHDSKQASIDEAARRQSIEDQTPQDGREDKEVNLHTATLAVEPDYPSGLRLTAIVISLLMGMFLLSLDNVRYHSFEIANADPLAEHNKHRHPPHHRRLQRSNQGLMVWIRVLHDLWRLPNNMGQDIQMLPAQGLVHIGHVHFRSR
jgi:hypothetical protein